MLIALERARLARDLIASLGLAPGAVLDSAAGPLQRAKLASQLRAKVAELVALEKPVIHSEMRAQAPKAIVLIAMRARLAKEINELLAQMGAPPAVSNEHIQMLTDIAEGRKDDGDLTALWALIYEAVEALQEAEALTGPNETLAHAAITRWAELEEKTNG